MLARNALLASLLFVPAVAFAAIGVNKTFSPTNVSVGQSSTLTVILINNNPAAATATTFSDNLPGSVVVATPANASNTCGGAITATPGANIFSFSGGTIPAAVGVTAGTCTVQVDVVSSPGTGVFINTIGPGTVTSSQGANAQAASATLTVAALVAITGSKAFLPTNLHGNGNPSTVTITLNNPNGVALTGTAFNDALPAGLMIAPIPNAVTTCLPNGVVTAVASATSASLATGTIPPAVGGVAGTCTVKFDVVASAPNAVFNANVTNSIVAGAVATTPALPASPAFSNTVRLQTAASMTKAFAPTPILSGGISTLTITINNFNASVISPLSFTDTLPFSGTGSVLVAPAPNVTTSASCGAPTVTAVAGTNLITVAGGSLAGVALNAGITNTTCTITVDVRGIDTTVTNPVTYANTIAAGVFGTVNHAAASGNLVINAPSSITASKVFVPNGVAPNLVVQGGTSTLTVTLNNSNAAIATLTALFTDSLATMGAGFTIAASPAASKTCAGGVLTATPGTTSFSLSAGATIPAAGSCTITIPVQVAANAATGAHTNTIGQAVLQTDRGRTQAAITAPLTVTAPLTATKAYVPLTVQAGASSRLTVTLTHNNGAPAFSGMAFTDTLPPGHTVSATPNAVTTCIGGTVTAVSGANSFSLAGGTLATGATSCTVAVNITSPAIAGSAQNSIPIGGVTTTEGFSNPVAATSTLTRVSTNVTLNKSFSPATVLVGGVSTLTINILNNNANALALTTTGLVDTLPIGMAVAAVPTPSNTCGGALTAVAGAGTITLTGGSLAAGATCTIRVNVVANASGNLIDTLSANLFTSAQGVTNPLAASATLAATGSADMQVTKTDGVVNVVPGTATTYTIVARNNGPQPVAGAGVVDTPPAGMTFTGWTCVASAGSACGNASGSGPINELVVLLLNGTATYTVTAAIAANATGTITNTATVVVPGTVIDTNLANNTASDTDTLVPTADLSITKTDGTATAIPGTSTTYTIVVANNGPSNVTGATITDLFPATIVSDSYTAVATGGATGFTAAGSGNINNTVNMPAGSTITYTVVANIAANAIGTVTNTATVTAPGGVTDPTPGNNSATDSDTLAPTADLSITKTDGTATAVPGSTTTYTIVVANNGPSSVVGATVADVFPAAFTSDTFTAVATGGATGFTAAGSGNINNTVNMPAGSTITYTVTANISASATGTLVNTATVTAPGGVTDPTPGNNSATDTDTLSATADLSITKTDGVASVVPGGTTTYTVVVTNSGPSNVTGATVTDVIPAAITSDTFTAVATGGATGFTASGSGSINNIVNMPAGSTITYTIVANISASASGTLVNTATVTAPGGATDPTPGNNSATDTDTLSATADLSITKTDGVVSVVPGTSTTYTVVVTNSGPSNVTGAIITDVIPAAISSDTFSAVATGGASGFTASGSGSINDTVNMPSGSTITYTIVASISASASGTLVNTATVTAPGGVTDPTPANNSATDSDVLSAQADLSVTKTDGVVTAVPGTSTTYTIVVLNNGPSAVTGATISDLLPPAILSNTFTAVALGGATGFTASGSGSINDTVNMPVGSRITYTVIANISASATGTLANTATVTAPGGVTDPTPGNNSATDTDTLTPQADLAVTKTDGVTTLVPGNATTYTIVVSNAGPSSADNAVFRDAAVANLTVTSVTCGAAVGGAVCPTVPNTTIALMQGTGIVVPTLPTGSSVTFSVTATVAGGAAGSIANTATVTAPGGVTDTNPGNNSATDTDTLTPQADLAITKTDGVVSVNAGGATTYTVVVTNGGPSNADNANFKDPAVANLTVTGVTCAGAGGGAACPAPINTTVALLQGTGIVVPTLPSGGSVTFTITATIPSAATGSIANVATVTAPAGVTDPTPGNNSATDTDTITLSADLSITKTDGATTVVPGTSTTYTIVVANGGPSNVTGATITDILPAAITSDTFTAVASGGATGFTASGSGSINDTVNMPAGSTITYTVVANIGATATGTLVNTATVTAPGGVTDPTPGNNSATDSDTLTPQADLAITKTNGVATLVPGNATTYTIVVSNAGPSSADNAVFRDAAVTGLTAANVTCASASGGAACPAVVNTTVALMQGSGIVVPTLPSGGSVTFTVDATVASSATGSITNTATITAPGGVTDTNPGNNTATDTDTLSPQVTLTLVKTDGSLNYTPGGTATYLVTVANTGASDAMDITATDLLPPGLTLTAVVTCTANGNALCRPVTSSIGGTSFLMVNGVIGAGAGNSLVFTVPVAFAAGMTTNPLLNTATATDLATGATASDTDSDTLAPQVSLAVAKTDGSATYTPGGTGTYTVTITHGGVSDATNVTISDPLPAGVTLTANASCAAIGSASCGTVTGTIGQSSFGSTGATIAAGAGNSLVFTVPVAFAASMSADPLDNTATALDILSGATGAATDSDTRAPAVTLAVSKTDNSATYTPGTGATYLVGVANTGVSDALNVTVIDTLPLGVTLSGTVTCAVTGSANCGTIAGAAPQTSFSAIGARIDAGAGNALTFTVPVAFAASLADNPLVNTATANDLASGATGSATDSDTLAAQVDLAITKTDGVTSVVPGTPTTYTIVVSNAGPSNVIGATVADVIPAAIASDTFTTVATGGATGFTASGSGNINDTVDMPVGSTITYTVIANVSGSAAGNLVNTATVTAPAGVTDTNPGNNSATDTDTLTGQADLSITKTDGVTSVVPGTPTTYTIVVSNAGPSNVTGATTADVMPAAIASDTFTAVATGGATGFTASGSGNINDTVDMPVGSTITYTVIANVGGSATGNLVNTATVTAPAGVTDTNPGNNSATDTDTLTGQADLSITKTDGVTAVIQGGTTTYTIIVTNAGPSAVAGANVIDVLPPAIVGDTFTAVGSGGAAGFTASGAGNINDLVNLPVGATITYTLVANLSASASGSLVNTATVTAPPGVTDTNPANNSATDTDTISLIPLADLGITKTDGSATYTPGNPISYTIVATNAGPTGVVGASVADIVPAAITGVTWTCTGAGGGTCPATGTGNIAATVNLPAGASVTFTLSGTVAPTATGNLVNTATVTTPPGTTDPNPGNNSATDTDTPTSLAGLAITKTDASATYRPGFPGTYTITVTNNGPSNANSVTVTDNLPAGVTLTGTVTCVASGSATCGAITGGAGGTVFQTTGATIAAGAGNRIVFTLPVLFAASMTTNPLTNVATASDPASVSVASASDTNALVPGPSTPIPVDNRWALALLAGFILLAFRRQSRGVRTHTRR